MTTDTGTSQVQRVWVPLEQAWVEFAELNPELRLSTALWAMRAMRRSCGPALMKADVLRRTSSRIWLAHRTRFPVLLFDCLTRGPGSAFY